MRILEYATQFHLASLFTSTPNGREKITKKLQSVCGVNGRDIKCLLLRTSDIWQLYLHIIQIIVKKSPNNCSLWMLLTVGTVNAYF